MSISNYGTNDLSLTLLCIFSVSHHQVQFEIGDVTKRSYKGESFDVVFSKDAIVHIKDKDIEALFAKFLVSTNVIISKTSIV